MFPRFLIACSAFAALVILFAFGCDNSTLGSNEGNTCDMSQPGVCGTGLECYVPPNCSFAVCCPAQDPSNPVCYCAPTGNGGAGGGSASDAGPDASSATN